MTLLICGSNELGEKNYEHISNDGAWCKCNNVLNLYLQNKLFTWFSFTVLSLGLLQPAEHTCERIFFLVHCADVSKMT